jgi:hypothetical protein
MQSRHRLRASEIREELFPQIMHFFSGVTGHSCYYVNKIYYKTKLENELKRFETISDFDDQ